MTNTPTAQMLTYPTPAMQTLIDHIRADIRFMRQWFDAPRQRNKAAAITDVTPVTVLATLETVVESVEPALRFYLNYPTQRLSVFLNHFVDEADAFVDWLGSHAEVSRDSSLSAEMYQRSCERLHLSLRDWHNAIILAAVQYQIDTKTPEIQH